MVTWFPCENRTKKLTQYFTTIFVIFCHSPIFLFQVGYPNINFLFTLDITIKLLRFSLHRPHYLRFMVFFGIPYNITCNISLSYICNLSTYCLVLLYFLKRIFFFLTASFTPFLNHGSFFLVFPCYSINISTHSSYFCLNTFQLSSVFLPSSVLSQSIYAILSFIDLKSALYHALFPESSMSFFTSVAQ